MLSELCMELILAIASKASSQDQKALLAVSKRFRAIIQPYFCASKCVVVNVTPNTKEFSQLKTLATGNSAWSHCRSLEIARLEPRQGQEDRMRQYLAPALKSLANIRTVYLTLDDASACWAQEVVLQSLDRRDGAHELCLVNNLRDQKRFLTLPSISHLTALALEGPNSHQGDFAGWIRQVLRRSPGLKCLRLTRSSLHIGPILEEEKVRVRDLSIPMADDALLRYLGSYSGLERLVITKEIRDSGSVLFGSVIPRHTESLRVLSCSGYEGGTCNFTVDKIALISQLAKLETLEMSVNADWQSLRVLEHSNLKKTIEAFLEMVGEMPALRSIGIVPAYNDDSACGRSNMALTRGAMNQIDKVFQTFKGTTLTEKSAVGRLIETHHRYARIWRNNNGFW
ncbi:hypothetical protein B0H16DRAFT_1734432 [Mycena metata]|uniref:F-box domain-containing protein n=1 Tax=Mycena metata TaxID=1033252 RepID=A0AAD7MRL4_9AGAR|nr:hypothetical protein B0H16DRAFT_1734432 [Mycena metata]